MWVVGVSVGRGIQPEGSLIPTANKNCKYRARDGE